MIIITCASLKGGCGKTSCAAFLALALARRGLRTLAVDLDHNNNLTDFFLRAVNVDELAGRNVYHFLTRRAGFTDCLYPHTFGLDILPATPDLSRLGIELSTDATAAMRLPAALGKADYNAVVIDTPPALSLELSIAIYAAQVVVCPVQPTRWTLRGFHLLAAQVTATGESMARPPDLYALPAMVTGAELEKLRTLDLPFTPCAIMKAAAVRTAGTNGAALRENSKSWIDFDTLAEHLTRITL